MATDAENSIKEIEARILGALENAAKHAEVADWLADHICGDGPDIGPTLYDAIIRHHAIANGLMSLSLECMRRGDFPAAHNWACDAKLFLSFAMGAVNECAEIGSGYNLYVAGLEAKVAKAAGAIH